MEMVLFYRPSIGSSMGWLLSRGDVEDNNGE